jgi:DNA-binding FadR family transcriptional regulator
LDDVALERRGLEIELAAFAAQRRDDADSEEMREALLQINE